MSPAGRLGVAAMLAQAFAAGAAADARIDYARDIQPLFDRYCVACHACFDAPCQLKLSHADGVSRGANKRPVYDGKRLEAATPTRLFIDAEGTAAWRGLDFFPVTRRRGGEAAILMRMLDLKAAHPLEPGRSLPPGIELGIRRKNQCAGPDEIDDFVAENPNLGMPFALPGMTASERERVRVWLAGGAVAEAPAPAPGAREALAIAQWEAWLNGPGARRAVVARWLFEHWAIARLYFDDGAGGHFFRLVRSRTAHGKPVEEIATRRPNSDPGGPFYYRFKLTRGTRVYKTHITFALDDALLRRIETLFLGPEWDADELPGYTDRERSNPFETFRAIPAAARYRFMLEHAEYFVRTFIRGPVCRGQLATDVIRDHFWVMFEDPATDPFLADSRFREAARPLLDLPNVDDDLLEGAETWFDSRGERNDYLALRQATLARQNPAGSGIGDVWDGDGSNGSALLTVFRHHDSATVKRGWLGQHPLTVWWMDFALFERSYYNLVVNFDVFGNLAHQAQTRLYFDLIRNGAEQNFLRLLPRSARKRLIDSWYRKSGKIKLWLSYQEIDTRYPSRERFLTDDPKRELLDRLLTRFADLNATPDPINRPSAKRGDATGALLSRLSGVAARDMPAIRHLPDAAILRVTREPGAQAVYTVIRNRRHSNVAFLLGESLRYEPKLDELSVVPGVGTTYPNYIFDVPAAELADFVATLGSPALRDADAFARRVIARWGVRRSDADFWAQFHAVNRYLVETEPLEAGILDLNRYVDY
ncbi:MAG: fatty acid cis/trans isomerase [Gammaproteobacteria bacterium]